MSTPATDPASAPGCPLPIDPLDRPAGSLHVITAAPRIGSTSLLASYVRHVARDAPVVWVSSQELEYVVRERLHAPASQRDVRQGADMWERATEKERVRLTKDRQDGPGAFPGLLDVFTITSTDDMDELARRSGWARRAVVVVDAPNLYTHGADLRDLKALALTYRTRVLACVNDAHGSSPHPDVLVSSDMDSFPYASRSYDTLTRMCLSPSLISERRIDVVHDRHGNKGGVQRTVRMAGWCGAVE